MADERDPGTTPAPAGLSQEPVEALPAGPRCPWCSGPLDAPQAERCPSCGANLQSAPEQDDVPGVTAVRPELLVRARRMEQPRRRGLRALFGGEEPAVEPPSQAELAALAPPDEAVRREMLRLELEAAVAEAHGEVEASSVALGEPALPPGEVSIEGIVPAAPDDAAREGAPAPEPDGRAPAARSRRRARRPG